MPPDRSLATKQMSGEKKNKTRLTLVFIVNSTGSHLVKAIFIGHAKGPRCFNKKSGEAHGFEYYWNKKAWMTGSIFPLYVILLTNFLLWFTDIIPRVLEKLNSEMRSQRRKILLYIDNAPSHIFDQTKLTNIRVEFLNPNMTSHIQPLDAGIIRAFKAHYRRLYILRALLRDEANLVDMYAIDQLEGMHLAEEAWSYVSETTVRNCWKHTGILPEDTTTTISSTTTTEDTAVQELQEALNQLSLSGSIASKNLPNVEELLHVDGEEVTEQEWSDHEIVDQAVSEEQVERGEECDESDGEDEVSPLPSNAAAYQAVHDLLRVCEHHSEPEYQQARGVLLGLATQLRKERTESMRQSSITQYFA